MSRHRNVRTMNYDDDYEGYYDVYGRSQEEDSCISPNTEEQFLYNREKLHSMSSFLSPGVVEEEEEGEEEVDVVSALSPLDQARLYECLEKMQNVVGDSIPEATLRKAALEWNLNAEVALDKLLSESEASKQVPRDSKRERKPLPERPEAKAVTTPEALPLPDPALRQTLGRDSEDKHARERPGTFDPESKDLSKDLSKDFSKHLSKEMERNTPRKEEAVGSASGATTRSKGQGKDAAAEYAKDRSGSKPLLNLVVIGHVDAGKSTLMGHLLYKLGCVQKKQMHKYEQDSKKLGKASFMYAWVLDETAEERNRGITMDVAHAKFETPGRSIVLLDAPGHKDFIPNMITGAAQADVAILVVDATRGEFETGFEAGGQTREHTLLVRSLGVSQLAVAINKLDNVSWDEARYQEIRNKLWNFLRQAGYREVDLSFVPCSGLTGENLTQPASAPELTRWYNGPCLLDVLDGLKAPERPVEKPFRLCVSDLFKGMGSGGLCVSGRLDSGSVANGDKVLIMPTADHAIVKGICIDEVPVARAFAGDQVTLTLSGVETVKVGSFLCDPSVPMRVGSRLEARVVVFGVEVPLTRGFPVVLHYQSTVEQASLGRILSELHKGTGQVLRNRPRCLTKNSSGILEVKLQRPICVELYKEFKELGRITLRSAGTTLAAGVITKVS